MDVYLTILLAIVAILLALYHGYRRQVHSFRKAGIIYKTPIPLLGDMWGIVLRQRSAPEVIRENYNLHPTAKYVGFIDFLTPAIVIRDLELSKSVAVKHFDHFVNHRTVFNAQQDKLFGNNLFALRDERWREVRTLLSPAFTSSKMRQMFKLMNDCAINFAEYLAKLPEKESVMEMKDIFTRYTNDVIATCAFGVSIDSMRDPNNDFYLMGKDATNIDGYKTMKLFLIRIFPRLTSWLRIRVVDKTTVEFFTRVIEETIRTRDEKGIHRPDMIQLMMDTRGKLGEGKELTPVEMVSQAFIFFFGGFDTTSTLMCFTAYELAINPDVQQRLREEVDAIIEECNGDLTYDSLNQAVYLDAVIYESLRKWPVIATLNRVCSKRFELPPALPGEKPYVVEKDSIVLLPCCGFQSDPQYFEEPEKFMPERFLNSENKLVNHPAHFPFGMGPRMCIGNRFALLEVKVMLAHIVHRCELVPSAQTQIPLRLCKATFLTRAEKGIWLKVRPRSDKLTVPVPNGVSQ